MKKVAGLSPQFEQHLANILIFSNSQNINHWCSELAACCATIRRHCNVKSKNLGKSELKLLLWKQPLVPERARVILYNQTVADNPEERVLGSLRTMEHAVDEIIRLICTTQPITNQSIKNALGTGQ